MRKGPRRSRAGGGLSDGRGMAELGALSAAPQRRPFRRFPRRWALPLGLVAAAGCALVLCLLWSWEPGARQPAEPGSQLIHKPQSLSSSQLKHLTSQLDLQRLWTTYLQPMLVERYSGSPGNIRIRQFIVERLKALKASWQVELDAFKDRTPHGMVGFANVVATLDPAATWRLVFACHYDSKYFPRDKHGRVFVGATDSALLFFDGEEAFREWSETDSLYGARHLAEHMGRTPHQLGITHLQAIDTEANLDRPTVENLCKILVAFLAEYLAL
ncbi:putative Glutaminyl-peptide cyclotransferase 2 protein [Naja naja]|nr:putative Glutaminyl-peptide cyclotransferase 2 protein [Naja naja]